MYKFNFNKRDEAALLDGGFFSCFLTVCLLFVLTPSGGALALGYCNHDYAGCTISGNAGCANCNDGFSGQYGYVDFNAAGYCCIDTKASGVRAMSSEYCHDQVTCTIVCGNYVNNKRYCWYQKSYDPPKNVCSNNVIALGSPNIQECPYNFYQCAPGYIWDSNKCNSSASNYGEYCGCKKGCALEDYRESSQSGFGECMDTCRTFNKQECLSNCQDNYDTCSNNCRAMSSGAAECLAVLCQPQKTKCENGCNNFSSAECAESCSIGCRRCPAAGNNQYSYPAYGWGANSQRELDDGMTGYGINSCRVVPNRALRDSTGEFEYNETCWYSE